MWSIPTITFIYPHWAHAAGRTYLHTRSIQDIIVLHRFRTPAPPPLSQLPATCYPVGPTSGTTAQTTDSLLCLLRHDILPTAAPLLTPGHQPRGKQQSDPLFLTSKRESPPPSPSHLWSTARAHLSVSLSLSFSLSAVHLWPTTLPHHPRRPIHPGQTSCRQTHRHTCLISEHQ